MDAAAGVLPGGRDPRLLAARIIGRWLARGSFPDRQIEAVFPGRAFLLELVYGAVKWRRALDWAARQYVPRFADEAVRPFLLIGLYQILFLETVADYAAVHATVAAAKAAGLAARKAGFVNAVLRHALRDRAALAAALAAQPPGIRLSHPDLLLERWTRQWGAPQALAVAEWDNRRPEVVLRVNLQRQSLAGLSAALAAGGIRATPHPADSERFLILPRGVSVAAAPGYAKGWFMVQDPSTELALRLLDPQPGDAVLDACAAPGGKTVAVAQRLAGRGRVLALELQASRLRRLQANVARACGPGVECRQGDIALLPADGQPAPEGVFDRILLDVPCSNTGVLRRRPDARWRFDLARLAALTARQTALLDGAAARLRPGGALVYSTCSIEPEENGDTVRRWLAAHPQFTLAAEEWLLPGAHSTDGAYAALLHFRRP